MLSGMLDTSESPQLKGKVGLETVSRLLTAADPLFVSGGKCAIDLGGLEESDSATVALLLEWKRRARQYDCSLRYTGIPQNLLDIARISQLDSILGQ
jgi:phospholipid transport system transporter-binding protein